MKEYLRTLKAVHSGADLDSASEAVLGYHQDACKGKEINVPAIEEVATPRMRELLHSARGFRDLNEPLHSLEAMLEARRELWPWTRAGGADNARLKDIIYLDLALESAVRQVVEGALSSMSTRAPVDVLKMTGLALENLALSSGGTMSSSSASASGAASSIPPWPAARLGAAGQGHHRSRAERPRGVLAEVHRRHAGDRARHGRSPRRRRARPRHFLRGDGPRHRRRAALADAPRARPRAPRHGQHGRLADHLPRGGVRRRGGCPEPEGYSDQRVYSAPTVLVSRRVGGEEEDIPPGVVAVITPDMPDVLSHVSVRARNEGCLFATVFDAGKMTEMGSSPRSRL